MSFLPSLPSIFTVYPIEIIHPKDGSKLIGNQKHTLVIKQKEGSITDKVKTVRVEIRDDRGNLYWKGGGKLNAEGCEISWVSPVTPGTYVMSASVLGLLGQVNSQTSCKFESIN